MLDDHDSLQRLAQALRDALPLFALPADAPLRLLTVSENATFVAGEGEARLVLRVCRPGYHDDAELRSEIGWIEALLADGVVDTPAPRRTVAGAPLVAVGDGAEARTVVAFTFAPGAEPAEATPALFRRLGRLAARLHGHSRHWRPSSGFRRFRWDFSAIAGPNARWGDWRHTPGLDIAGQAVLVRAATRLEAEVQAFGEAPDRFGLIHGDMRAANLLLDGERLQLIDFDDCGFSWFAADFAASVSFIEHRAEVPALADAWVEGYRRVAPFPREDEAMLPAFVLLRRLQLTAWIASHAETPTAAALKDGFAAGTALLADRYLLSR